ncbi:MAG TPA: DUF222 domain-containing protein [Nocardioidaceae bacterium]|nr:DUF222 domain-containing protein [Nocardioidaceae bacterium]
MSTAPGAVVEQAQRLVSTARLLPADEAATALEQAVTMLQAAQAQILVEAERSGDLQDSGCATVRSFAATILRRSVTDAGELSQVARHLAAFPQLAAAYAAGLVHTPNLRTILRHRKACGLAALQAHEDLLVALATQAGPQELAVFCQHIAEVDQPDRDQAKAKALGLRSVRLARVGDLAHLDAMLDPVLADQLKATLAAMTKASRQPHDPRTHAERSADALEQLLGTGMDGTAVPTQGRHRPHTSLHVDVKDLLGLPGHGRPLLARFGLVSTPTAARVTCDSLVQLIVTHGARVLHVGRRHRLVNDAQRTALAHTHPTCVMPGCAVRFGDCDIHHLWWWSQHGPTDLDLQVPLCRSHHVWLHEGGYCLTRDHGHLVFRDRRGRVIANTTDKLTAQLDLLDQRLQPPHPQPAPGDTDPDPAQALADLDDWTATPYNHGTWGWNGPNPSPPPGHAPPQWPEV